MQITTLTAPTPAFADLVERHTTFCDATAPPGSCHRLPLDALFAPELTVWVGAEADGTLLGMGALKALEGNRGEIKSMHTIAAARGRGLGRALLRVIMAEARRRGYTSLWLETGVHPDFAPARALYAAHGFAETGPFDAYVLDPHSTFMTRPLEATA